MPRASRSSARAGRPSKRRSRSQRRSVTGRGQARLAEADELAALLELRIANGDYLTSAFPSERALAEEAGVSYITARKAVNLIAAKGLLGAGTSAKRRRTTTVLVLIPAFPSLDCLRWLQALERLRAASGMVIKHHYYAHWDDPVMAEALRRDGGVFLYPTGEPPTPAFRRQLAAGRARLCVIDQDWSALGVPSVCLSPARFVVDILDHLANAGHRRIACINTQPHVAAVLARLDGWRSWLAARGLVGETIDQPVQVGRDATDQARQVMAAALRRGAPGFTALFATTVGAALGAMRALQDAGVAPGRRIAVATLNDEGIGHWLIPSLTAQALPDPVPFLEPVLGWMSGRAQPWSGTRLIVPDTCVLAARESTLLFAR